MIRDPRLRLATIVALVASAIAAPPAAAAELRTARVAQVVDGDTALIRLAGATRTVKLRGIDAPATGACYGPAARSRLRRLLPRNARIRVDSARSALVYRGSQLVNRVLVAEGYARTRSPGSSKVGKSLTAAQRKARTGRLGLWGTACEVPTNPLGPIVAPPPLQPRMTAAQAQAFLSGHDLRIIASSPEGSEETHSDFCPDGRLIVTRRRTVAGTTTVEQEIARWQVVGVIRRLDDAADQIEFTAVVEQSSTPGFDPSVPADQRTARGFVVVGDDGSVLISDRAVERVAAGAC